MSERIVKVQQNQIVTATDFNNFGLFPRSSQDHVVRDTITDQAGYVQFQVVESGPAEITVAPGRYYKNGEVYARDDEGGVTIDLSTLLPAVTRKIVTVVVWGNTVDTATEPRTFLLDPVTRTTEARVVSTESRRIAYIDRVPGQENVDPQPPALDANVLGIAYVTLSTTGIQSIEMIAANRMLSLKSLNTRLTLVEKRLDLAGSQIDTLRTDISGLAMAQRGLAPLRMVTDLAADFARTKRLADLPDDYTAWAADNFLDESLSDTEHADYDALAEEGLHFPDDKLTRSALTLTNPLDERIAVIDNMVFPRAVDVTRISVMGRDSEVALATTTSSTTEYRQLTRSRTEWQLVGQYETLPPGTLAGADWKVTKGEFSYYDWDDGLKTVDTYRWERVNPQTGEREVWQSNIGVGTRSIINTNGGANVAGGRTIVQSFWQHFVYKAIEEPYIDTITTTEVVQGFQIGQTFLNSQEGELRKINLFFTRKAAAGDVKLFVVDVDATGRPDERAVLGQATIVPASINADPSGTVRTTFDFGGVTLVKGRRYALWGVSQGSHWLARVHGNKYAQGAFYQKNNNEWVPANGDIDLAFEAVFAEYSQTRVEVQLQPVTLAGGIGYLEINADTALPAGTSVIFEINAGYGWVPFPSPSEQEGGPLYNHPAIIQMRAVLLGTTDAMPGFGIGPTRSCVTVSSGKTAFVHVSKERTLPAPVDTVEVVLRMVHWEGTENSVAVKLLTGGAFTTVETADATVDMPEPVTLSKLKTRKFVFNLAAPVSSYKIRIEGATTDMWQLFTVMERTDVAYTS